MEIEKRVDDLENQISVIKHDCEKHRTSTRDVLNEVLCIKDELSKLKASRVSGSIIPTVSTAILTFYALYTYVNPTILKYMADNWPVSFFNRPICAILPLQMVAFGALGSIAGYWLAVKHSYWRKHVS